MNYHFYSKERNLKKLVTNFNDKTEYVIHIRHLKQALNHGLNLKKFQRVIKFNQKAWLKPYIVMNTEIRQKSKKEFLERYFQVNE